jgi:hypothetical protein
MDNKSLPLSVLSKRNKRTIRDQNRKGTIWYAVPLGQGYKVYAVHKEELSDFQPGEKWLKVDMKGVI